MTKIEEVYRAFLKSGRPDHFAVNAIAAAIAVKHLCNATATTPEEDAVELDRCYREIRESDVRRSR